MMPGHTTTPATRAGAPDREVTMFSTVVIATSPAGTEVPMHAGDTLLDEFGTAGFRLNDDGRFHSVAVFDGRTVTDRAIQWEDEGEAYDHALAMLAGDA